MILRLRNPKELYAGVLFTVIGIGTAIKSTDYDIGSATRMGPGYFPELLGLVLIAFGVGIIVRGFLPSVTEDVSESRSLTPLILIIAGVLGFALTIDRLGLVVAIGILLGFACLKHAFARPIEVLVTIVVLMAFSVSLFVYGFQMPFNAF